MNRRRQKPCEADKNNVLQRRRPSLVHHHPARSIKE